MKEFAEQLRGNIGSRIGQLPHAYRRARILLALWLFRIFRLVAQLLPPIVVVRLGRFFGFVASYFSPREMSFATTQIRFAGILQPSEDGQSLDAKTFARRVFAHVGEALSEIAIQRSIMAKAGTYIRAEGGNMIDELQARKQAAIALSGHLGCMELLAAHFAGRGANFSVVTREPRYPFFHEILRDHRAQFNVHTIWRHEAKAPSKIISRLKEGGVIAALIDQDIDLDNFFSPFFGLEAATPVGMIKIAIKYQLPIITSFIVREKSLHHVVKSQRIDYESLPKSSSDFEIISFIIERYNAILEELIRAYPDQWIWWHRRWRRRPGIDYVAHPEALFSSTEYLIWLEGERLKRLSGKTPE